MQRHPAFQDLSRDHFAALLACLHVQRAAAGHPSAPHPDEAVATLHALWKDELIHHFAEEDADLGPVLDAKGASDLVTRLRADHGGIRAAMASLDERSDIQAWAAVAEQLRVHIRWEEDELFEWMQGHLAKDELGSLLRQSVEFRTRVRGPASVRPPRT